MGYSGLSEVPQGRKQHGGFDLEGRYMGICFALARVQQRDLETEEKRCFSLTLTDDMGGGSRNGECEEREKGFKKMKNESARHTWPASTEACLGFVLDEMRSRRSAK